MKDVKAYLERLRVQLSECETIRDLATDPKKRELFARLADHFSVLASELEKALRDDPAIACLDRKTQEPVPKADD